MSDIRKELEKRVLVIDGAMGTMIQQHQLNEADYRGERFKEWKYDLKGNNDLLSIKTLFTNITITNYKTIILINHYLTNWSNKFCKYMRKSATMITHFGFFHVRQ